MRSHFSQTWIRLALIGASAWLLPLSATEESPVTLRFGSRDALRVGTPLRMVARIEAGVSSARVELIVTPSKDWAVPGGSSVYAGALDAGQPVEVTFAVIALQENPEPLRARLLFEGREVHGGIDPALLGGGRPEVFEADEVEPAPAIADKAHGERKATYKATGRWVFAYDGVDLPVRKAKVELWNAKADNDLFEHHCATGSTDGNGNFEVSSSSCSDLFSGPDLQVRLILDNDVVEVKPDGLFASSYTAVSDIKVNRSSGTHSFGTIRITSTTKRRPFRLHNLIVRAHEAMVDVGVNLPKVHVIYPANTDHNHYTGWNEIKLVEEAPFDHEAGIFHEYAHHFLNKRAESPSPDYSEGGPWHPDHWAPELGVISWTEGFPDFFAALLYDRHRVEDRLGTATGTRYRYETRQPISAPVSEWDRIEGVIAAILWDIVDSADDDQDETGPGRRDNLDLKFLNVVNVILNYDPEPWNPLRNHPVSIHELFDGFRQIYPQHINRIAEVYREHRINKPLPDLLVSSTGTIAATIRRGQFLQVSANVANAGPILANNGFALQWRIGTANIWQVNLPAGMSANSTVSASMSILIPSGMATGMYTVHACADSGSAVPESDEDNNCRYAGAIQVNP
jgi:hypothetical protein